MNKVYTIILLLMFFTTPALACELYNGKLILPIGKIYDGDTIHTELSCLPKPLNKVSIRVLGVDTPEKGWRAKCEYERKHSIKARQAVVSLAGKDSDRKMIVSDFKWDKFGGRIDGFVEIAGQDITRMLIHNGFAYEYWGGKKESWCK